MKVWEYSEQIVEATHQLYAIRGKAWVDYCGPRAKVLRGIRGSHVEAVMERGPVDYMGQHHSGTAIEFDLKSSQNKLSVNLNVPSHVKPKQQAALLWAHENKVPSMTGILVAHWPGHGELPLWYWLPVGFLVDHFGSAAHGDRWGSIRYSDIPQLLYAGSGHDLDYLHVAYRERLRSAT